MKKFVLLFAVAVVIFVGTVLSPYGRNEEMQADGENTEKSVQKLIDVPIICQYPELPTGCESVAAAMVLQLYGENISAEEFAAEWLACSEDFYYSDGELYGPDPNEFFAGNPFSQNAYGCFASAIVNAVNGSSTRCSAEKITGKNLQYLCREYIDKEKPLLIWATSDMKEPSEGSSWYLPDGSKFRWISGEHCLVLVGYNEGCYFFNDPQADCVTAYEKGVVEKRFEQLGKQAVYISA